MKIEITLILIVAVILSSCTVKKNTLEELNLEGKIWKIKETRFAAEENFGKYQIGDERYYGRIFYDFNEDGNLIEIKLLNSNSKLKTISKFTYDEDSNCTEVITYDDNDSVV